MSSNIFTQEKAPLLPVNGEEECQRLECYKNKVYKRKYKQQTILVILFMVYFFYNAYFEDIFNYARGNKEVHNMENFNTFESVQDLSTFDTLTALDFEAEGGDYGYCRDKPTIPFTGPSKFEIDANDFPKLSVSQKTKSFRGQSISWVSGNAVVFEDKNVSKVTVEFDLKFNHDDLQGVYYIEEIQHNEEGLYELILKNNDQRVGGCVTIDITVRLPTAAALDNFSLSIYNGAVHLKKGLTFKELAVAVSNGSVEFPKGITSAKTGLVVSNGHLSGVIDTLSDELHAHVSNGHVEIEVKEIDSTIDIPIEVKVSNGHINFQVPKSFESTFSLKSVIGKTTVESSAPQNIHNQYSRRRGITTGYYGDNSQVKNSINLTTVNGGVHLNYA